MRPIIKPKIRQAQIWEIVVVPGIIVFTMEFEGFGGWIETDRTLMERMTGKN